MERSHAANREDQATLEESRQGKAVRMIVLIAEATLVTIVGLGVVFMFAIPQTGIGSIQHVEENFEIDETIVWSCPIDDKGVQHELTLGITKADFERSMSRDVMRYGTILDDTFAARFIEPNDPFVKAVADHISSLYPENKWPEAALYFVQASIEYVTDDNLYGAHDFTAYPVETLYLQRGDCEDTSVLLCSIYEALGIRSALLDYPDHMAVGVYVSDDDYLFCETTCDRCEAPRKYAYGVTGEPRIYSYGDHSLGRDLADCIASYRNFLDRAIRTVSGQVVA